MRRLLLENKLEQLELSHQSGRLRAGLVLLYKAC
jgi:hypothetical protein